MGDSIYHLSQRDDYAPTPLTAVSSFNPPAQVNSNLTTPVTTHPGEAHYAYAVNGHYNSPPWDQQAPMNHYNQSRDQRPAFDQNLRMRQNIRESPVSIHPAQTISTAQYTPEFPQGPFESSNIQNGPYYPGSYAVSEAAPANSPASSAQSNAYPTPTSQTTYSTVQPTYASAPQCAPSPPAVAPILQQPDPNHLRNRKRSHDDHIKQEYQTSLTYPPPQQQYTAGASHYNNTMRQHSPPHHYSEVKRRRSSEAVTFQSEHRSHSMDGSIMSPPHQQFQRQHQHRQASLSNNVNRSQYIPSDEDLYLLQLRQQIDPITKKEMDWKKTTKLFNDHFRKESKTPALQMKLTRMRERMRPWTDKDITALKQAKRKYDMEKWKKISQYMVEISCEEPWSVSAVRAKCKELFEDERGGTADEGTGDEEFGLDEELSTPLARQDSYSSTSYSTPAQYASIMAGGERRGTPMQFLREQRILEQGPPLWIRDQQAALEMHTQAHAQRQRGQQQEQQQQQQYAQPYGSQHWQPQTDRG